MCQLLLQSILVLIAIKVQWSNCLSPVDRDLGNRCPKEMDFTMSASDCLESFTQFVKERKRPDAKSVCQAYKTAEPCMIELLAPCKTPPKYTGMGRQLLDNWQKMTNTAKANC